MKMKIINLKSLAAAALTATVFAVGTMGHVNAQDMKFFRIGSGSAGGSYYPIAGLISQSISSPPGSRKCEDGGPCGVPGLVSIAQSSNGSVANVNGIKSGQLEAGLTQSDVAFWAHSGTGLFEGQEAFSGLRAIAALFPESIHVVAAKNSDIKTVNDFKGKTVGLGAQASGALVGARFIIDAYGLKEGDDFTPELIHSARSAERIKDGQADAFITVTGYPQSAITELTASVGAKLVPVDGEARKKIVDSYPFYAPNVIPGGVYAGNPDDTQTIAVSGVLVTSIEQDEEMVYQITKALFNKTSQKLFKNGHAKGKDINLETAMNGLGVPLHPGAERFYREAGLIK